MEPIFIRCFFLVALARTCSSEVAETEYRSSFSESEHLPHELQEPFRPSGEVAWAWYDMFKIPKLRI